jgi:hypothetical protein
METPPDLLEAFKKEFAALAKGPPIAVQLTPVQAWAIMSTIQLACRHPDYSGPTRRIAEEFARALQQVIATSPTLKDVAKKGWHAEFDEPIEEETG